MKKDPTRISRVSERMSVAATSYVILGIKSRPNAIARFYNDELFYEVEIWNNDQYVTR